MKLKFENISIYNLEKRPSLPSILHCTSSYSGFSVSKYVDSGININDSVALDIVDWQIQETTVDAAGVYWRHN